MREAREVKVEYYVDVRGRRPCEEWLNGLDSVSRDLVLAAIYKRSIGNTGQSKPVGGGVHELRPGRYRVYYGVHGDRLIVLLGGGSKRRQQVDINDALSRWRDYKGQTGKAGRKQ